MKKGALIIALVVLFAAVSGAAVLKEDKEFMTGLKHYNSKNYKEAISHFKEYAAKKPDPAAYYLIGYSLYKLGKFSEADEYFKEAFFVDPDFSLGEGRSCKEDAGRYYNKGAGSAQKAGLAAMDAQPVTSVQAAPAEQKPTSPQPSPAPAAPPCLPLHFRRSSQACRQRCRLRALWPGYSAGCCCS